MVKISRWHMSFGQKLIWQTYVGRVVSFKYMYITWGRRMGSNLGLHEKYKTNIHVHAVLPDSNYLNFYFLLIKWIIQSSFSFNIPWISYYASRIYFFITWNNSIIFILLLGTNHWIFLFNFYQYHTCQSKD